MRCRTATTVATPGVAALLAGCGSSTPPASNKALNEPLEVWARSTEATTKVYEKIGVQVDHKPIFNDFDKRAQQRAVPKDLPDVVITDTGPYLIGGFGKSVGKDKYDPRRATVAGVYKSETPPFPSVPNFTSFRQKTSESLNSIFAKCPTDSSAELKTLAEALKKDLENQKASQ